MTPKMSRFVMTEMRNHGIISLNNLITFSETSFTVYHSSQDVRTTFHGKINKLFPFHKTSVINDHKAGKVVC